MLGRKQSIKVENILADYGNEEIMNESADVEWVNKVSRVLRGIFVILDQIEGNFENKIFLLFLIIFF